MSAKVIHLMKLLLVAVLSCSLLTIHARANEVDPEQTVQNYWAAIQKQDWATATRLVHPQYQKRIRAAAGNYADALLAFDKSGLNLKSEFGVTSKEEFDKLSDAVVFQRTFEHLSKQPGFAELLKATTWQIIGHVKEGDGLVHIICRRDIKLVDAQGNRVNSVTVTNTKGGADFGVWATITIPERDKDIAEVITTKRDNAAWLVLPGTDIEDMLNRISKNLREITENLQRMSKTKPKPQTSDRQR